MRRQANYSSNGDGTESYTYDNSRGSVKITKEEGTNGSFHETTYYDKEGNFESTHLTNGNDGTRIGNDEVNPIVAATAPAIASIDILSASTNDWD